MRKRSTIAKDLRSSKYRPRVVVDKRRNLKTGRFSAKLRQQIKKSTMSKRHNYLNDLLD